MRGLLLLLLTTAASAQDKGIVKPTVIEMSGPWLQKCAIPLLEVAGAKNVDRMPVVKPAPNIDPKMILPAIPICGKDQLSRPR